MSKLVVDVWSDVVCPWCYIGKHNLARAIEGADVEVVWHAFELDPRAPSALPEGQTMAQRLASKYRMSVAQAEAMIARVEETARRAGVEIRHDLMRTGNTFDAHRLLQWARGHGRQDALKERLMRGYMAEGAAIADRDTLARLAAEAGLDGDEARRVLDGDRYAREVRDDEALAREIGITGVPFFVMGGRVGVSGAQPVETLRAMLDKARQAVTAG